MKNFKDKKWVYLEALQTAVKQKLKGDVALAISQDDIMQLQVKLHLGRSTLERFFGIDKQLNQVYPRQPTRDKLANYIGFKDFNAFVIEQTSTQPISSLLVLPENQTASTIEKQAQDAIIKHYHRKLALALSNCCQRLEIVFRDGMPSMQLNNITDNYLDYRHISTLYRLCAVLGWLHIIRKDWAYLHSIQDKHHNHIYAMINTVCQSLAQNPTHYEQKWLKLLEVLAIAQNNPQIESRTIVQLQYLLSQYIPFDKGLVIEEKNNELHAPFFYKLHKLLRTTTKNYTLSLKQLLEYQQAIMTILDGREAWIYEDWQIAIGELMVKNDPLNERYFSIVDYGTFEQWLLSKKTATARWIRRIQQLFDQLDFAIAPIQDARINQLKNTYQSMQQLWMIIEK